MGRNGHPDGLRGVCALSLALKRNTVQKQWTRSMGYRARSSLVQNGQRLDPKTIEFGGHSHWHIHRQLVSHVCGRNKNFQKLVRFFRPIYMKVCYTGSRVLAATEAVRTSCSAFLTMQLLLSFDNRFKDPNRFLRSRQSGVKSR